MMQFIVPRHNSLSVSSIVCVLHVSFVHVCVQMCVLACGGKRLVWGVFLNEPLHFKTASESELIGSDRLAGRGTPGVHCLCLLGARIPDVQHHAWLTEMLGTHTFGRH